MLPFLHRIILTYISSVKLEYCKMSRRLSMENVAILKVNKLGKEKKDKKPGLELRIN